MYISSIKTYFSYPKVSFCANNQNRDKEKAKIQSILNEAKDKNQKVSCNDLSQAVGVPLTTIAYIFKKDKELQNLYQETLRNNAEKRKRDFELLKQQFAGIKNEPLPESTDGLSANQVKLLQVQHETEQIRKIVQFAKDNNIQVTCEQIAGIIGSSTLQVQRKIDADETLHDLFKSVMDVLSTRYSKADIEKQTEQIRDILKRTQEADEKITAVRISEMLNIHPKTVMSRIDNDEELTQIWYIVGSSRDLKNTSEKTKADIQKIRTYIQDAINEGRKISLTEISRYTAISSYKLKNIMEKNIELKSLYSKVMLVPIVNFTNSASPSQKTQKPLSVREQLKAEVRANNVLRMIFTAQREQKQLSYNAITQATGADKDEIIEIVEDYKKQRLEYQEHIKCENAQVLANIEAKEAEALINQRLKPVYKSSELEIKREQTPLNVSETQYRTIGTILNNGLATRRKVSLATIAKAIGQDEKTAYRAIKSKPAFLKIWQEVKAPEKIGMNSTND